MKKLTLTLTAIGFSAIGISQNVGINTDGSAPTMMLHVKVASGDDGIRIQNNSGTGDGIINFQDGAASAWTLGFDANDNNDFKISNGGALGTNDRFIIDDANNQILSGFNGLIATPAWSFSSDINTGMWRSADDELAFSAGGVEFLVLDEGGTDIAVFNENSGDVDFRIESNGNANMFFVDGGANEIGIGTGTPAYDVEVSTNDNANYTMSVENTNANYASFQGVKNAGTFNAIGGVTNVANGLGAYAVTLQGNPSAGTAMYAAGNSSDDYGVFGQIPTAGTWNGYGGLFVGGLGYVNGAYNLSDRRFKKNIEMITNPMDILNKINGVYYNYNTERYGYAVGYDERKYAGFIAQEVGEALPEAVADKYIVVDGPETRGPAANMADYKKEIAKVVDYTAVIPVLVEAIKDQQAEIEELKEMIRLLTEEK